MQKFSGPPSFLKTAPGSKAIELRERALRMPTGPERDELLREADRLDHSARTEAYLNSSELKPPT